MKLSRLRLGGALVAMSAAVLAVGATGGAAQPSRATASTISPQTAID